MKKKEDQVALISAAAASASSYNKIRTRAQNKKEDEVALIPAAAEAAVAASSHNKRRRAEKKKKEDKMALIPTAPAAAPKKSEIAEKKKKPQITVNKKIPQGDLQTRTLKGVSKFNMHKSLAGKKVLLYGLPGYFSPVVHFNMEDIANRSKHWMPFYQNSVINPALEFIKQADYLKENGVDEIVFFSVNYNLLMGAKRYPDFMGRYEYVKFICDYKNRYLHALGIEMDMPQERMPLRSRRFILLVDNLKVKFAIIESRDEIFTIPSSDEIIKAFNQ